MVKAFTVDPELAAATGSVEILPWSKGGHGLRHIMAECEFLEYFSSFNVGRQYQTATGSLFTLAGAFSVFRRSVLLRTFMYDKQTVSEDTKLTFELHKMFRRLKKACIPESIAFTEATPSLSELYSQRVRWQRGQLEVAALFPDEVHSPFKLTGLASAKSLLVDHTLAFTRIIWTFLLPMLYFIGYPLTMVVTATIVMYICYMVIEGITILVDYIVAEKGSKARLRRDWWLFSVMPAYRFLLFWMRLGGFVSVLMASSEWKTEDPGKQLSTALSGLRARVRSKKP
jgi:biofilm PGA synthesis N-glycosyltransferase PgaC